MYRFFCLKAGGALWLIQRLQVSPALLPQRGR